MKHKLAYIILFLLTTKTIIFSQGGSNYSIFGLGDINTTITSGYEGMGGASVAVPLPSTINITNPAMISQLTTTRLSTGYRFNQNFITTEKSNLFQNNGNINGLLIAFVFDSTRKIAASMGVVPSTKVNFLISNEFKTQYLGQEIKGKTTYSGAGGLSSFFFNFGSRIVGRLYAGATLFGNFGSIVYSNEVTYTSSYTFATYYTQEDYFSGLGYKIGTYLQATNEIGIGAYYGDYGKLSVERNKSYSSELLSDTTIIEQLDVVPPKVMGVGLSYRTGKFLLGLDYKQILAENLNYTNSTFARFRQGTEIAVGGVRFGNPSRRAEYLDRVDYRMGFTYTNLYYEVAGQNINEYKISFGMGMPFAESGMLDASVIFGNRGTTQNGLVSEYFGRLVIDFSIGETWFVPFKREY